MILKHLRENWKAGLAVALVSIPLSISLAVASGTTPMVGIITAIWAGFIASLFGGSNFNIVGPTGALSGIIAVYAFTNGAGSLAQLTILVGIFIFIAYILKLEHYLVFIPSSVIHGFTLGVACIIGLNQFNYAFGLKGIPQHKHLFTNLLESCKHIGQISWVAFAIFIIFFVLLIILRLVMKKISGTILLAPVGILLGYLSKTGFLGVSIETLGDIFSDMSFKLFVIPDFAWHRDLIQTAAIIALIAILETMLSAKIADGMTHTKHNPRKEMLGLGLANIVCGFLGGIPATAALARTSLNIKAHATNKLSATLSSIFVALISFFLLKYFAFIPVAVIAAILVYTAVQMIEAEHFVTFFKYERANFWISMLVAIVTVYEDPIAGILLGATISLLLLIDKISRGQCDIHVDKQIEEIADIQELGTISNVLLYSIKGKLCYINSCAHLTRFEIDLSKYQYVIIRLREIYFIDLDGAAALDEIIALCQTRGQKVLITSVSPHNAAFLQETSRGYQKLKQEKLVFKNTREAIKYLAITYRIRASTNQTV